MLSTLLLIVSDQLPDGLRNPKCLAISQFISDAVDYQKNGSRVNLDAVRVIPEYSPRRKPDFLGSKALLGSNDPRRRFYESQSVLGELFRMMTKFKLANFTTDNSRLRDAVATRLPPRIAFHHELDEVVGIFLKRFRKRLWQLFCSCQDVVASEVKLFAVYVKKKKGEDGEDKEGLLDVQIQMQNIIDDVFVDLFDACSAFINTNMDESKNTMYQKAW